MKKILLIALIFLTFSLLLAADEEKDDDEENLFSSYCAGVKFDFSHLKAQSFFNTEDYNWGLKLNGKTRGLKLNLNLGKLSLSGALSRLNNPALSSSLSPFFTADFTSSTITADFSGKTFTKPMAVMGNFSFIKEKKITVEGGAVFLPDSKATSLFLQNQFFVDKGKLLFSITVNASRVEEFKSDKWMMDAPYYAQTPLFGTNFQTGFMTSSFKTLQMLNFYLSPWNTPCFTFRSENQLKKEKILVNLEIFYSPSPFLLTPGGTKVSPKLQFKEGITFSHKAKNQLFTTHETGFSSFQNLDLYNQKHNVKFAGGYNAQSKRCSLKFISSLNFYIYPAQKKFLTINEFNFSFTNTWNLSLWSFSFTPSLTVTPKADKQWTFEEKIAAKISYNNVFSWYINTQISFVQKEENAVSPKIDFHLGITYKIFPPLRICFF